MNQVKRARLEAKGWHVGRVDEFLDLGPDESTYIELKLELRQKVREYWRANQLTQMQMAKLLGTSQSVVARIEIGDTSVSLDLLIRVLLALGVTRKELGRMIADLDKP
ncbi:MAG: helix-turn-helix transcriptional regulator [Anaerolineales bacterium]|nr:helix-turn-helix transcriptional regulator [Anaerolineales bacterium]